jgi:hypothetical protein
MPTFFQPVALPERCFLEEVLYWVAFERLPVVAYEVYGKEIRESDELEYEPDIVERELTETESERAGIPSDPRWRAIMEEKTHLPSAHYDRFLADPDLDPGLRKLWISEREESVAYEQECEAWQPHFEEAVEFPQSRIFVALKEGRLPTKGRLLPSLDLDEATVILDAKNQSILDIEPTDIAPSFWTLKGTNFESSSARNSSAHYCHISCLTDDVLRAFPGSREEIVGVERIGDTLILSEKPRLVRPAIKRGRPSYPWDGFHLEVANLLRRNEMPDKKEAAIEYFQSWFEREHGIRPSRAAVGEKLKPYFDKFIKPARQKI